MASILDFGSIWTLTDAASELLHDAGFIEPCNVEHTAGHEPIDKPIYHVSYEAAELVRPGSGGMFDLIDQAHRETEVHP